LFYTAISGNLFYIYAVLFNGVFFCLRQLLNICVFLLVFLQTGTLRIFSYI